MHIKNTTVPNIAIFKVKLVTVRDVEDFVRVASSCSKGTEITVSHGKYITDGKSLMGIFSLNLSEPVDVEIKSTENSSIISSLLSKFDKWRIED